MSQVSDLSRSLAAFDQNTALTVVVELSEASWLVAGLVPGLDRQPLKKQEPNPVALLRLLERWRAEAVTAGRTIERIALAFEAGRDGFWLARWLQARGIEVHVIHSTSVAVSREHRRAKTDRLDTALLMRVFLGWLRGERGHCRMVAIPTLAEEDARRPSRERESLVGERTRIVNRMKAALARLGIRGFKPELRKAPQRLEALRTPEDMPIPPNMLDEIRRDMVRLAVVREQVDAIERARLVRLEQAPATGPHAMVRLLACVIGVGVETADMLVQEVLCRNLRDRRAVARYAGLTGSPDESGKRRREKGLAKGGQCPRAPWPDPTCLAVPEVPEGQRARAMVPGADRVSEGRAQNNDDRGARPQTAHRAVAHGHDRRNPGWRCIAAGGLSGLGRRGVETPCSTSGRAFVTGRR
jgi:transposase